MQHRFVGDIGDFIKMAILRALAPDKRLGIAWWMHPEQARDGDGQHLAYLRDPGRWRHLDPWLFDHLADTASGGVRHVSSLEKAMRGFDVKFAGETIPIDCPPAQRPLMRESWLDRVLQALHDTDLIFADPDNGFEPATYRATLAHSAKSIQISEVERLASGGRSVLVYHHHTRRQGGHMEEIRHWAARLRAHGFKTVDALRAAPYSPRVFFLINGDPVSRRRAEELHQRWRRDLTWHPDSP